MGEVDFSRFEAITFDCYGTLIDWEQGILNALQPVLAPREVDVGEDELLERYARHEAVLEAGDYLTYREVLAESLRGLGAELGFDVTADDARWFAEAMGDWPAFHDTAPALRRLHERFRLGVITNCDRDLFARSNRRLGVTFDWIVAAEDARAYKPSQPPVRTGARDDRVAPRADPPRRPVPLPRPRARQAARPHHCLGRPPPRPAGIRCHPRSIGEPRSDGARHEDARRRRARLVGRHIAGEACAAPLRGPARVAACAAERLDHDLDQPARREHVFPGEQARACRAPGRDRLADRLVL